MIYTDNKTLIIELKKLLLDEQLSSKQLAERLELRPQMLQKIYNKKNLAFSDLQKILDVLGYDLEINFKKRKTEE